MDSNNMRQIVGLEVIKPLIEKVMEYQNKGYGTAFIDFSGHIAYVHITLHHFGWEPDGDPDYDIGVHIESEYKGDVINRVKYYVEDIDSIMKSMPTVKEHAKQLAEQKEKEERELLERLKEKYENKH